MDKMLIITVIMGNTLRGLHEDIFGLLPDGTGGFRALVKLKCWDTEMIVMYSLEGFKLLIQMLLTLGLELELEELAPNCGYFRIVQSNT